VVLPGDRSDPAHLLGYRVSHALVATWPATARNVVPELPEDVRLRIEHLGGLSRIEMATTATTAMTASSPTRQPCVTVLTGAGGTGVTLEKLAAARRESPAWSWQVLAPPPLGTWVADPAPVLRGSDVVISHAGQNAIAEVAAARRPAIVIPEWRPHREQEATARALSTGSWPVTVLGTWPERGWPQLLSEASARDGATWRAWCDGRAAQRFADVLERIADRASDRRATA
jgi:hypothetical protein